MSLKKICRQIKKYNNFLIISHTNPEGDALGAQLGFYNLIKKLGKRATIVSQDPLPYGYDFLPGNKLIRRIDKTSRRINFDCVAVLDCADLKRTGEAAKLNIAGKPVLNIDHHISNKFFGDVNWVEASASSCSEMIYKLYKQLRVQLDKESALVLYTGIMTDTGSFRYSNTSSFTHQAVADLLKFGIDVVQVYRSTYENIPLSDVKSLLKLLGSVQFDAQGKIAWFKMNQDTHCRKQPCVDLADLALSFGRSIKAVEVVVLFKENLKKHQLRVNLRSQGKVDVNKIAFLFGGGGHKTAAGCTLHGQAKKNINKVLKACQLSLRKK
ncbi:MAG: bifunctional oligoribonuclease/PAP phosphatase NrnA [Candidatus Omnitrophica bacterium]|nr:bifunctional oligoribonuclease/PAP phosphatase NrnA [Candidatus Omnitrophota bacterium]